MGDGARFTGPDLRQRILKLQHAVEDGRAQAVRKAGDAAQSAHESVMRSDSGGDLRLSGVGRNGAKIGVRVANRSSGLTSTAKVSASGPLPLIDKRTKPHRVPRLRSRGRRRVIAIPGIGVRAWANHPGTPGKDTWRRGRSKAEPKIDQLMRSSMRIVIAKGMAP